jgi:hypothetical protein
MRSGNAGGGLRPYTISRNKRVISGTGGWHTLICIRWLAYRDWRGGVVTVVVEKYLVGQGATCTARWRALKRANPARAIDILQHLSRFSRDFRGPCKLQKIQKLICGGVGQSAVKFSELLCREKYCVIRCYKQMASL